MEKQKWIVRIVSAILVVLMLGTLLVPMMNMVYADTGDDIKAELDRLDALIDDLNSQIQANQNDAAKAEQMSEFYQKKEAAVRAQIDALKQDIAQRRADLEQKQQELALQVQKVEQGAGAFERTFARYVRNAAFQPFERFARLRGCIGCSAFFGKSAHHYFEQR